MSRSRSRRELTLTVNVNARCDAILNAFFEHTQLMQWWHIQRSLCVPRTLGCYAVEWESTGAPDDILGRLGGVFHGTVMTFDPQREFFVAEAYWMAPDGEPLGPMAFDVSCSAEGAGSLLRIRQSGADASRRADRYYEVMTEGLTASLQRLKTMLESSAAQPTR